MSHAVLADMRRRTTRVLTAAGVLALFVIAAIVGLDASPQHGRRSRSHRPTAARRVPPTPPPLPCGDPLSFQVLLDRERFSPGEIDGTISVNTKRAIAALQAERHLSSTGEADCETWHALAGDSLGSAVAEYEITADDVKGPFTKVIPRDLDKQAALPALDYRSPLERVSERFHASPALLRRLNPHAGFTQAGTHVMVPAVDPFNAEAKPASDPLADEITIRVSKSESSLRALKADGTLVRFAPVTSGSEHDPLPIGSWQVTSISWRPFFHYNPKLFWDADPSSHLAVLKPGPNNPVGVVWIQLNLEHYGLHGTPEPASIGMTQSHGCVRLTNWDAARVAALVKRGTAVTFTE